MNNHNIFVAASIKVAEAAKVIENAQRDINIAFINEIAMVFGKMGLSTYEVLEAAQTKWNFLPFSPGLVGGHCIGVDPYYLAACAEHHGHYPKVILSGRHINDHMGFYIAGQADQLLHKRSPAGKKSRVLILGLTFKENVPDLRNTKVMDMVHYLRAAGHQVDVHDPLANPQEAWDLYGLTLLKTSDQITGTYEGVIGAVAHQEYRTLPVSSLLKWVDPTGVIIDIKNLWRKDAFPPPLHYWGL